MSNAQEGQGPIHGELGSLAEDGDRLQCHLCGQWYRSLAAHVLQRHHLTAHEYRAAFGLSTSTALVGPSLVAVRRATGLRVLHQYTRMQDYVINLSPEERSVIARGRAPRLETRRRLSAALRRQVAVACAVCGGTFEIKISRARRPERHTCSPACRRALLRQDAQRDAHRTAAAKNLAQGNTARWGKKKSIIAERLQALDSSAFAVLSSQDRAIICAYYGLDGGGHLTQQELALQFGLTLEQVRGRLKRGIVRLLESEVRR